MALNIAMLVVACAHCNIGAYAINPLARQHRAQSRGHLTCRAFC